MTYTVFMRNQDSNARDAIILYGLTKDEASTISQLALAKSLGPVVVKVRPNATPK